MTTRCIGIIYEKIVGQRKYVKRRCTRRPRVSEGYCLQHAKEAMRQGKIEKRRL